MLHDLCQILIETKLGEDERFAIAKILVLKQEEVQQAFTIKSDPRIPQPRKRRKDAGIPKKIVEEIKYK